MAKEIITLFIPGRSTMKERDKLLESDFLENGPPTCCELLSIIFAEDRESATPADDQLQAGRDREADALSDADKSRDLNDQEAL